MGSWRDNTRWAQLAAFSNYNLAACYRPHRLYSIYSGWDTHTHRQEKNLVIFFTALMGTESSENGNLTLHVCIYLHIEDYAGLQVRFRCAQVQHEVQRIRFHGSRGGVFVGHQPRGTPVTPRYIQKKPQRSFTSIRMSHAHTHQTRMDHLKDRLCN